MSARPRIAACLAAVYLIWGSSYLATRIGVAQLPPLLFSALRFLVAGTLLLGVALLRGWRPAGLAGEWRHVLVLGVFGLACVTGLQVWAMQWVPSGTAALLNTSCAFWIVAFGRYGRRAHRPSARALAGVALGFLGTALLLWPAVASADLTRTALGPQLVILAGCIVWAVTTIYLRSSRSRLGILPVTGAPMLVGGAVLGVAGLAAGEGARWSWSPTGLYAMGWLTLFSACIAYSCYAYLARHAAPALVGTYAYVNPVVAVLLGYLVLREELQAPQVLGMGTVLLGVLLINWPARGSKAV